MPLPSGSQRVSFKLLQWTGEKDVAEPSRTETFNRWMYRPSEAGSATETGMGLPSGAQEGRSKGPMSLPMRRGGRRGFLGPERTGGGGGELPFSPTFGAKNHFVPPGGEGNRTGKEQAEIPVPP